MITGVKKELKKLLKGKRILFIEGDNGLYNYVGEFEKFLVRNKIPYHTILNAGEMSLKGIQKLVNAHDVIVWQSQYVSQTALDIMDLLFNDKLTTPQGQGASIEQYPQNAKILLECYIVDPLYWYKPKGLKKRLMGLTNLHGNEEHWELYEFKDDHKPIWEKSDNEL